MAVLVEMCSDGRLVRSELGIFVFYLDLIGMQSIDKELEKILFENIGNTQWLCCIFLLWNKVGFCRGYPTKTATAQSQTHLGT